MFRFEIFSYSVTPRLEFNLVLKVFQKLKFLEQFFYFNQFIMIQIVNDRGKSMLYKHEFDLTFEIQKIVNATLPY